MGIFRPEIGRRNPASSTGPHFLCLAPVPFLISCTAKSHFQRQCNRHSAIRGPAWQATKLDPSRSYSGRGQGTGTSEGSRGVGVAKGIFPSSPLHSLVPVPSSRIRQCKHQQETTGTESGFGFAKRRTLVEGNWRVLLFMFCLISISREENVIF